MSKREKVLLALAVVLAILATAIVADQIRCARNLAQAEVFTFAAFSSQRDSPHIGIACTGCDTLVGHLGQVIHTSCYDNIPLSCTAWQCRATFANHAVVDVDIFMHADSADVWIQRLDSAGTGNWTVR